MAAQAGSGIIISIEDENNSPSLQVIAGLRTRSIAFNHETVDVTNANSTGLWRELLSSGGVRSATFSGDGVFTDDNGMNAIQDAFFQGEKRALTVFIPGLGTFSGDFVISSFEVSGEYNGEVTNSLTLESAGVIAFVTAA
jgi:TP901-1 family phage major tail protein